MVKARKTKQQIMLDMLSKKMLELFYKKEFELALDTAKQMMKLSQNNANIYANAAAFCVWMERYDEAIEYGLKAKELGEEGYQLFDGLAHAYGSKREWDKVKEYGVIALEKRLKIFGLNKPIEYFPAQGLPPYPSFETKDKNIIAFSLFGNSSKYCETAILNVVDAKEFYPNWTTVFYIDSSVSMVVRERIEKEGGRIVLLDDETASRIPGPMWRFLAYDIEGVHRVIFRDADSVVSKREAGAVNEWVESKKMFHHMRDFSSHTELMLAGLWGAVIGGLPSMKNLIDIFTSKTIKDRHFADQFFLRELIWPYAKESIMCHDSIFDFYDSKPFPLKQADDDNFNVGYAEGTAYFTTDAEQFENNSDVIWSLRNTQTNSLVCSYDGVVLNQKVSANIPRRYAYMMDDGILKVELTKKSIIG